ncbi:GNAT family N-acetyltransferase [Pseudalkalibacillus berkeleyi]|uniref:GNAT family N-acetyltransferase n=1 Tax=Pseudalkalibacillus berkeleyi TaxID=1069813 RepID=A0ABS9H4Z7_9BACL|nr:GNAT family N-acetyltransferase [Pseudalkalibacillus berkeleyi]MCF6138863.1 GNAT family N-acetyltransferase [Pseudalkalibacillus berkeleyi]
MKQHLWKYVRGVMWDYESVPDSVEFVERDELLMYKTEGSNSILSNKVAKFDTDENVERLYDQVRSFYGEKAFSWWIGPDSKPDHLASFLQDKGFTYEDTYYGMVLPVNENSRKNKDEYDVIEVESEKDVRNYVEVGAQIWNYDEATIAHLVKQRLSYVKDENRRGGLLIMLDGDEPVGHAGYRFSADGVAMYLAGSGVIPQYRKQGIYRSLLAKRMELARLNSAKYIVTQARKDNSEPVLRKLGFVELGNYEVYRTPIK